MALLLIGNSLQGTLLALRATAESFTPSMIGLMASGYFLGFVAGTLVTAYMIERAGHIRAFTALASLASASALGHIIFIDPWAWAVLRAISGLCFAGIYMTIESWLNERATNETRGQILATYMIVNLLSLTGGQILLMTSDPNGYVLFCAVSVLVSVAIVPVALTRTVAPTPEKPRPLPLKRLIAISPLGVLGCFAYGAAIGAFWGLAPVFAEQAGLAVSRIAIFMSLCILGGGVMQWPIGWLSDRFDRRTVLAVAAFAAGGMCLAVAFLGPKYPDGLLYLGFAFGAVAFPIYALTVAHANDFVGPEERVVVSGTLLLVYGIGAIIGPLAAGQVMHFMGPLGLFKYMGAVFLATGAFAVWRMTQRAAVPIEEQASFVPAPSTTPVVMELDPNAEPSQAGTGPDAK